MWSVDSPSVFMIDQKMQLPAGLSVQGSAAGSPGRPSGFVRSSALMTLRLLGACGMWESFLCHLDPAPGLSATLKAPSWIDATSGFLSNFCQASGSSHVTRPAKCSAAQRSSGEGWSCSALCLDGFLACQHI